MPNYAKRLAVRRARKYHWRVLDGGADAESKRQPIALAKHEPDLGPFCVAE